MPRRTDRWPRGEIAEFCRRNGIAKLSVFGSVLRDDFGPDSDIDVLVEFQPGLAIGMLGMARLAREMSTLFGRTVDLRTPSELSRYFRDDVLRRAEVQYAGG